jgi:hypothetical protein
MGHKAFCRHIRLVQIPTRNPFPTNIEFTGETYREHLQVLIQDIHLCVGDRVT